MKIAFLFGLLWFTLSLAMSVLATRGVHVGFFYATAEIAVMLFAGLALMLPYSLQLIADVFRSSSRVLSTWLPTKRP